MVNFVGLKMIVKIGEGHKRGCYQKTSYNPINSWNLIIINLRREYLVDFKNKNLFFFINKIITQVNFKNV